VRIPEYVLTEKVILSLGHAGGDPIVLEAGSFVKPIHPTYIPKWIKEDPIRRVINPKEYDYCFTRYGIFPIKRSLLRKV